MLKHLTSETERALRDALPPDAFREAEARYFEEPRGRYQGQAGMVLAPASTADVQKAVQIAHSHATAIIPYGGGTGL
ncbi:MAG: hydroxyacid dehydrogenase, partial [Pseudomonadota bacterium]